MDILIGTKNHFKIKEMLWHLDGLDDIIIHFLDELPHEIEVEENGKTLLENARKKAIEISKRTDWLVFTSDAGVDIPGLKEQWDMTKPKRMVGENSSDRERIDTLLRLMKGLKGEERMVVYHLALAVAKEGKLLWSEEMKGESGIILEEDHTENIRPNGWIAVVWHYPELQKTDYQLTEEERTAIRQLHQLSLKKDLHRFLTANTY